MMSNLNQTFPLSNGDTKITITSIKRQPKGPSSKDAFVSLAYFFFIISGLSALVVMIWGIVEIANNWHAANCSNWKPGALQTWFIMFALPLFSLIFPRKNDEKNNSKENFGGCLVFILLIYGIVLGAMGFCDEVKESSKLFELYLTGMSSIGASLFGYGFLLLSVCFE